MTSLPLHPDSARASTCRPLSLRDASPGAAAPRSGRDSGPPLSLAPGAVLSLRGAAGRVLHLLSGRVWLTEPNDPDDHVLHAGQSHRLRSSGAVVVENDGTEPVRWRLD